MHTSYDTLFGEWISRFGETSQISQRWSNENNIIF